MSSALATALANLTNAFSVSGPGVGSNAHNGTLNWQFAIDNSLTQYLAAGQTVTATYKITITDDSNTPSTIGSDKKSALVQDLFVTITGGNDLPSISVAAGNSASAALIEGDAALTSSGTLCSGC